MRPIVLFGGTSTEHRVSVASAQNVAAHLPAADLWFQDRQGHVVACDRQALLSHARPFETDFHAHGHSWPELGAALDTLDRTAVVFLALHGGEGENGSVQAQLEARGLAFTGADARASALAFDKGRAKRCVAEHGVLVARELVAEHDGNPRAQIERAWTQWGRFVAKPLADGSSIGLVHVRSAAELESAVQAIEQAQVPYLLEEFIDGTELTVGVVGRGEDAGALPPSEVRLDEGHAFDFSGKYLGRGTLEITPAEVAPEIAAEACRVALVAHRAIGCEGYSRTDVIASRSGVVFLELNTLPGLTRASFIPQQLAAAGRDLGQFVQQQLAWAQARRDAS